MKYWRNWWHSFSSPTSTLSGSATKQHVLLAAIRIPEMSGIQTVECRLNAKWSDIQMRFEYQTKIWILGVKPPWNLMTVSKVNQAWQIISKCFLGGGEGGPQPCNKTCVPQGKTSGVHCVNCKTMTKSEFFMFVIQIPTVKKSGYKMFCFQIPLYPGLRLTKL